MNKLVANMKNLLADLEIQAEIQDLRSKGLTEEEIAGYFDFYADSWIAIKGTPSDIN